MGGAAKAAKPEAVRFRQPTCAIERVAVRPACDCSCEISWRLPQWSF